jgi:hypothetical protein
MILDYGLLKELNNARHDEEGAVFFGGIGQHLFA